MPPVSPGNPVIAWSFWVERRNFACAVLLATGGLAGFGPIVSEESCDRRGNPDSAIVDATTVVVLERISH